MAVWVLTAVSVGTLQLCVEFGDMCFGPHVLWAVYIFGLQVSSDANPSPKRE